MEAVAADNALSTEAVVASPGNLQPGAETTIAAANVGVEVPTTPEGLQNLELSNISYSIMEYADSFSMRPGAPVAADGGVITSENISFRQLMETEFMGTKWYDQIYGSEYSVGDRTMLEAAVKTGLPIEEAARRAGITDLDAPLNLEDPEVLARVTNAVVHATHGKRFAEGSPPFSQEQLTRAAYTALGEEPPPAAEPDAAPVVRDPRDIPPVRSEIVVGDARGVINNSAFRPAAEGAVPEEAPRRIARVTPAPEYTTNDFG